MRLGTIALLLLMSAGVPGEGFEALGRHQTDWYSRGIIRGQTINVITAQQKKQQYLKRKKRKARAIPHRHKR
jgi:hypothetical protein